MASGSDSLKRGLLNECVLISRGCCDKLGGLAQQKSSRMKGRKSEIRWWQKLALSETVRGASSLAPPSLWWFLAVLGFHWPVDGYSSVCLHLHMPSALCVCVPISLFL